MVKYIALLLFLMLSFAVALPAEASFCRNSNDRSICILSIKRSAKNYWEYRVAVSVDGVERPIEVYNCRDRVRVRQDGTLVPFEPNGPGELVCSFFQK
jgi:biopolymer transport protein ExbD